MKRGNMREISRYLLALCVAIVLMGIIGIEAKAAMNQTAQNQTSITISWAPNSRAEAYYVRIGADYTSAGAAQPVTLQPNQTSYTFNNLQPGTEYYATVSYKYTNYSGEARTSECAYGRIKTLPGKVTGVNQVKWWYFIENVEVKWADQTGVDGYEFIMKDEKGKTIKAASTYGTSTSSSVKNNMVYNIVVRAYSTINGQKYYGDWSDKAYLFTQPMVKKATVTGGKLKLTWEKTNGVTGYDIYISNKEKTGYKKVKSVGKNKSSVTLSKFNGKKFSAGKTYYVYLVAKKKVGKTTYTSGRLYTYNVKKHSLNWTF